MGWIELHRKPGEDDKAFFAHELGPGFVVEDASRNRGEEAVYLAVRYASGEWEGKTVGMVALYSESPSRFRYIPSESMPIIFLGGRFTIAIAVFPTSSSGS